MKVTKKTLPATKTNQVEFRATFTFATGVFQGCFF